MKSRLILILITVVFLSSCFIIAINENDYRVLNEEKLKRIKQFDDVTFNQTMNYDSSLYLYEIIADDIKEVIKNQNYTWVHFWRPYCGTDYCQNIIHFIVTEEKFQDKGLEFLMVSETYEFHHIDTIVRNSNYPKPIFVIKDAHYGHKMRANKLQIHYEFHPDDKTKRKTGEDDYLFKGSELIYAGRRLDENMIDSLLQLHR